MPFTLDGVVLSRCRCGEYYDPKTIGPGQYVQCPSCNAAVEDSEKQFARYLIGTGRTLTVEEANLVLFHA